HVEKDEGRPAAVELTPCLGRVGGGDRLEPLLRDCLGEEGPVVGIVVDGEQDRAWFQLRLAAEQGADGLDQVLTSAELAARPGRPWPEVADEAIGPRGERAFAF